VIFEQIDLIKMATEAIQKVKEELRDMPEEPPESSNSLTIQIDMSFRNWKLRTELKQFWK